MFKGTSFYFTEPICKCQENKISFGMFPAKTKADMPSYGLFFECKICGTKLSLSPEQWNYELNFDKPYPGKKIAPNEEQSTVEPKDDPKKKPN